AVARRTGEIGLRMALGALPRQMLALILRESLALVCAGTALGLAGAYASGRLVAAMLFGITPGDPAIYVMSAVVLAAIGLVAALVPAVSPSRIQPLTALRAA